MGISKFSCNINITLLKVLQLERICDTFRPSKYNGKTFEAFQPLKQWSIVQSIRWYKEYTHLFFQSALHILYTLLNTI